MKKELALICPVFPPFTSSAAVQLHDLAKSLSQQGNKVTIFTPTPNISKLLICEQLGEIKVIKIRTFKFRDVGHICRVLAEIVTPFLMIIAIRNSKTKISHFDGLIWYSPSIFFTPLASYISNKSKCKNYLIVRDIFPQWALDLDLLKRGVAYYFFKYIEIRQYELANYVGIQAPGNLKYFKKINTKNKFKLEILNNWIQKPFIANCCINLKKTKLAGKKIFVYAGNVGVAQDLDSLLIFVKRLTNRSEFGFLVIGRGSEFDRLSRSFGNFPNLLFCNEIASDEIAGLYKQCDVGIVSLNQNHKTHNIPGKFVSYMASSLPVFALVNKGNDLIDLIENYGVGVAFSGRSQKTFKRNFERILKLLDSDSKVKLKCFNLYRNLFETSKIAKQITSKL